MTRTTYWLYAVRIEDGREVERHGPFECETDLVKDLEHNQLIGDFDIVRSISIYPAE